MRWNGDTAATMHFIDYLDQGSSGDCSAICCICFSMLMRRETNTSQQAGDCGRPSIQVKDSQ